MRRVFFPIACLVAFAASANASLHADDVAYYCTYGGVNIRTIYYSAVFTAPADQEARISNAWANWLTAHYDLANGDASGCRYDYTKSVRERRADQDADAAEAKSKNYKVVFTDWSY